MEDNTKWVKNLGSSLVNSIKVSCIETLYYCDKCDSRIFKKPDKNWKCGEWICDIGDECKGSKWFCINNPVSDKHNNEHLDFWNAFTLPNNPSTNE